VSSWEGREKRREGEKGPVVVVKKKDESRVESKRSRERSKDEEKRGDVAVKEDARKAASTLPSPSPNPTKRTSESSTGTRIVLALIVEVR